MVLTLYQAIMRSARASLQNHSLRTDSLFLVHMLGKLLCDSLHAWLCSEAA